MDPILKDISERDTHKFTDYDPKRAISLKEYVFMVGFSVVAQHTYPGQDMETACNRLQNDLDSGIVIGPGGAISGVGQARTSTNVSVAAKDQKQPCNTCGGGRVR